MSGLPPDLRAWERLLAAEGLPAEPSPLPAPLLGGWDSEGAAELRFRRIVHEAVFERAVAYLWTHEWTCERERAVWEAWAVEAMTIREIARHLGRPKSTVAWIVAKHRGRCGIGGTRVLP